MLTIIPVDEDITEEEFLCSEIQNAQERRTECWNWIDVGLDVFWHKYVEIEEEIAYARQMKLQEMYDTFFREEVFIRDIDEETKLYKVKSETGTQYELRILDDGEYFTLFRCDVTDEELEKMTNYYQNIQDIKHVRKLNSGNEVEE